MKLLWHDGQGLCLLAKRLDRGKFIWPRTEGEAVTITPAQLGYLLEGIDWRNPVRSPAGCPLCDGYRGSLPDSGSDRACVSAVNFAA